MINRELIRLKVVQLIYAYYQNGDKTIDTAVKEFDFSMSKAYDLYKYLLSLLVELKRYAEKRDEVVRSRSRRAGATMQGTTVDGQFAENKLLVQLAQNKQLAEYMEKQKKDWLDEDPFVKKLYTTLIESDVYQMYMTKEDFGYDSDRELVRKLYKTYICGNEDFDSLLEERSLYWNDDKEIVDSFVLKTIKRFNAESTPEQELLPQFSCEDDHQFALKLFTSTIEDADKIRKLIKDNCKNWEFNRLAFMDVIIAQIALAEALTFPNIPLSVTLNEYLDIAKAYSTPRSAGYLNGMLDHILRKLHEDGVLDKTLPPKQVKKKEEAKPVPENKPRKPRVARWNPDTAENASQQKKPTRGYARTSSDRGDSRPGFRERPYGTRRPSSDDGEAVKRPRRTPRTTDGTATDKPRRVGRPRKTATDNGSEGMPTE